MLFPDDANSKRGLPSPGRSLFARSKTLSLFRRFVPSHLLLLGIFFLPLNAVAQQAPRRVLVLTGSDPNHPGFSIITKEIRSTLRDHSPSRVELLYELQLGLIEPSPAKDADDQLISYLKQKYSEKNIDLVLVMAAPRFRILRQKDATLLRGIPEIFYDFDNEREATNHTLGPNLTGVWASLDLHRTLDLALALEPNARKVVVISGNSSQDAIVREGAQGEFRKYESRVEFSYLIGDTVDELKKRLAALDKQSVVLFLTFTSDKAGNRYSGPETLSMIAPASAAPIFGYSDTLMGLGITGGNLLDFEGIGKRIGEMSLRVLAGEKPELIPQETAPSVSMVDWRELQRWGISPERLPEGTLVKFRQPSVWELYKWYAIGFVAVVIIEALLIAWLLFLRARRRQAEEENLRLARAAKAEHKRLDEIVSNVPGIVWEATVDPATKEQKTTFISEYLRKMLGYTPDEWLAAGSGLGSRIMPEEDRDRALRETQAVLASGTEGVSQFRLQGKDGKVVWAESHLSPISDESHNIIGLRGVTLDITERKLAEETLRQTEEKDRAILRAMPDLMFLQTRDGVFLDYHAKDAKDLFAPPETFLHKNMRDVLPAELADEFFRCFQQAEEMGEPQILEYQLTINETKRWFEARMVRSGENILSVVRDITQRIFIEEAIKRNEAQLAGIIGSAMDAIITVDEDQRIMLFNAAAEKMFECSQAEATSQSLDRFIPESFRLTQHVDDSAEKSVGRSPGQIDDLYGRKSSGEEFPLEASISQIELNDQKFYTVILRDVTERKRAIDELRQSEERFSKAFRSNPQPMSLTTMADARYVDVNKSFLEMSGYTREEVIGRTSIELQIWESPAKRADFVQQLREGGSVVNVETTFQTKDGSRRFLLSSAELLEIDGQQCLLVASSDITERKESEEALRAAHEEVSRLKNQLQEENIYLQEEINLQSDFGEMVGRSDALRHVLFKIDQVARTETTVLITGETGTGKELVARAIHNASARAGRPLVKVNCAALSPSLIESEFFGHEKGAFTGASARKIGRFELANGATIFLDEIGELPTELQVKLLRVIQEGEFERLGSSKTIKADVRIIAATNRTLDLEVRKGRFREDLWYRLNVFPITVPPLRQRQEDIPLLVEHFARRFSQKLGKAITSVSPAALRSLRDYTWPGNVRELANVIERAVINSHGPMLRIGEEFVKPGVETLAQPNKSLEELERDYIVRILHETGWRIEGQKGAARILGINPSTLRARMSKLGIQKPGNALSRSAR
jgi:PAS domain S-box-containing protein